MIRTATGRRTSVQPSTTQQRVREERLVVPDHTGRDVKGSLELQVVYKVYEQEDLKPLLEEVNAERQKEKDEES